MSISSLSPSDLDWELISTIPTNKLKEMVKQHPAQIISNLIIPLFSDSPPTVNKEIAQSIINICNHGTISLKDKNSIKIGLIYARAFTIQNKEFYLDYTEQLYLACQDNRVEAAICLVTANRNNQNFEEALNYETSENYSSLYWSLHHQQEFLTVALLKEGAPITRLIIDNYRHLIFNYINNYNLFQNLALLLKEGQDLNQVNEEKVSYLDDFIQKGGDFHQVLEEIDNDTLFDLVIDFSTLSSTSYSQILTTDLCILFYLEEYREALLSNRLDFLVGNKLIACIQILSKVLTAAQFVLFVKSLSLQQQLTVLNYIKDKKNFYEEIAELYTTSSQDSFKDTAFQLLELINYLAQELGEPTTCLTRPADGEKEHYKNLWTKFMSIYSSCTQFQTEEFVRMNRLAETIQQKFNELNSTLTSFFQTTQVFFFLNAELVTSQKEELQQKFAILIELNQQMLTIKQKLNAIYKPKNPTEKWTEQEGIMSLGPQYTVKFDRMRVAVEKLPSYSSSLPESFDWEEIYVFLYSNFLDFPQKWAENQLNLLKGEEVSAELLEQATTYRATLDQHISTIFEKNQIVDFKALCPIFNYNSPIEQKAEEKSKKRKIG